MKFRLPPVMIIQIAWIDSTGSLGLTSILVVAPPKVFGAVHTVGWVLGLFHTRGVWKIGLTGGVGVARSPRRGDGDFNCCAAGAAPAGRFGCRSSLPRVFESMRFYFRGACHVGAYGERWNAGTLCATAI